MCLNAGLVSTWSAYNHYQQTGTHGSDPLLHFQAAFQDAAMLTSPDEEFDAVYPLFLMLCKRQP